MFPGQEENRDSFFARLDGISEELMMDIDHAYFIAKAGHGHDERKGELDDEGNPIRYFEHPRRSTIILMDEIGCHEPLMICGSLLHDIPEDARYITIEKIERWFRSPTLARLVAKVSKIPKEGYLDRLWECARSGDWQPLLIKLCDRLDNMRSLECSSRAFQRKQGDETRLEYLALFVELLKIVPGKYKRGATKAFEELRYLVNKYETRPDEVSLKPTVDELTRVLPSPNVRDRLKKTAGGEVGDDLSPQQRCMLEMAEQIPTIIDKDE